MSSGDKFENIEITDVSGHVTLGNSNRVEGNVFTEKIQINPDIPFDERLAQLKSEISLSSNITQVDKELSVAQIEKVESERKKEKPNVSLIGKLLTMLPPLFENAPKLLDITKSLINMLK